MKPIEQRGDSDCLRACLASILELTYDDVPDDVCDPENQDDQHNAMQRFLRSRGLIAWSFGLHGVDQPMLTWGNEPIEYHLHPTGYWLASVESPRNDDWHVVVMKGAAIVWDPHLRREMGHRGFAQAHVLMPFDV